MTDAMHASALTWVDTHCHLDAPEFDVDRFAVRQRATALGVQRCVIPAVAVSNFEAVRALAHATGDGYCLGIHPLYVEHAGPDALQRLDDALSQHRDDPHLLGVGEIGLDYFVPTLCESPLRERQEAVYRAQLQLAKKYDLPVVLHVRRSADRLLKHLREVGKGGAPWWGIAHAFNGSDVQATAFVQMGFKLGFGGAVTFERANQLRHLVQTLPLDAIVLETDAPDMPPHWLYTTAQQREAGTAQGRNSPDQIPAIAEVIAQLRNVSLVDVAQATTHNACEALPGLNVLLRSTAPRGMS